MIFFCEWSIANLGIADEIRNMIVALIMQYKKHNILHIGKAAIFGIPNFFQC